MILSGLLQDNTIMQNTCVVIPEYVLVDRCSQGKHFMRSSHRYDRIRLHDMVAGVKGEGVGMDVGVGGGVIRYIPLPYP